MLVVVTIFMQLIGLLPLLANITWPSIRNALLASLTSPWFEPDFPRRRSPLRLTVDSTGAVWATAWRIAMIQAVIFTIHESVVFDGVGWTRRTARVFSIAMTALRKQAIIASPLVLSARAS